MSASPAGWPLDMDSSTTTNASVGSLHRWQRLILRLIGPSTHDLSPLTCKHFVGRSFFTSVLFLQQIGCLSANDCEPKFTTSACFCTLITYLIIYSGFFNKLCLVSCLVILSVFLYTYVLILLVCHSLLGRTCTWIERRCEIIFHSVIEQAHKSLVSCSVI
jgi:hypothetical protein